MAVAEKNEEPLAELTNHVASDGRKTLRKGKKRKCRQGADAQPPKRKRKRPVIGQGSSPVVLPLCRSPAAKKKPSAWDWWSSMGCPRHIMAPMVGQSELAFRQLCRRHGTTLCYTPMLISKVFLNSASYRRRLFQTCHNDRPLIAQFCGNDPRTLVQAALLVQDHVDGVDFNLGCPQMVAKRSNYGSWLMDQDWRLLEEIVSALSRALSVPVTVKIRRFDEEERTVAYARMLQDAGASLVCLHPRQRHEKEEVLADWSHAARIKRELHIPVIGNGDVWHAEDAWLIQRQAGVDGVMSAQGLLHNPALFAPLVKRGLENGPTKEHLTAQRTPDVKVPPKDSLPPHFRRRRPLSAFMTFRITGAFKRQQFGQTAQRVQESVNKSPSAATADLVLPGAASTFMSTPDDVKHRFDLAEEYVRCCFDSNGRMNPEITPCHPSIIRRHMFFILFDCFQANCDLIDELNEAGGKLHLESLEKNDEKDDKPSPLTATSKVRGKEKWKARKKSKKRIFTDPETGKTFDLGHRYFLDESAEPYMEIIRKLRERAERGSHHPDALAAVNKLKTNGNPRTRRRDGTFAPPDWPVGGGNFNVEKRDKKAAAEAHPKERSSSVNGHAPATPQEKTLEKAKPEDRQRLPSTNAEEPEKTGEKRKLSKAERKQFKKAQKCV